MGNVGKLANFLETTSSTNFSPGTLVNMLFAPPFYIFFLHFSEKRCLVNVCDMIES